MVFSEFYAGFGYVIFDNDLVRIGFLGIIVVWSIGMSQRPSPEVLLVLFMIVVLFL